MSADVGKSGSTDGGEPETFHTAGANIGQSRLSRRGFMRAATAGGTAAVAGAAGLSSDRFGAVDDAEAIAPVVAGGAIAAGTAAGAAAGYAVSQWRQPDSDIDADDVTETQVYSIAQSVAEGRETFEDELQHEYLEPDDPQQTPFGRTAWSEIRVTVARAVVNGKSESEVLMEAQEELDRQVTIAGWNMAQRWKSGMSALVDALTLDEKHSVGSLELQSETMLSKEGDVQEDARPVEASKVTDDDDGDDEYLLFYHTVELPTDASELEDVEGEVDIPGPISENSMGTQRITTPFNNNWGTSTFRESRATFRATHSSYDTITVLDAEFMGDVVETIQDAYSDISDELDTYVSSMMDSLDQGAIDPDDILGPQDVADHFADSSEQERFAGELMAIGAEVPDDAGYRAKIAHEDLQADEMWAMIYPQFDGDPVAVAPGTTIGSEDYRMAYIGYESAIDGEWTTDILSGDHDLDILDVENVTGQEEMQDGGQTAGESGRVVVHAGDDVPDPIADRDDDEYAGWIVRVAGGLNDYSTDLSDVESDGDEYVLPTTDLEDGETIERIEVLPSVEYDRTTDYVADPTEVDDDETIQRIEDMSDQVDAIEDALDDGGIGGGGIDLGGWFSGIGQSAAALGAGVLALIFGAIALGGE